MAKFLNKVTGEVLNACIMFDEGEIMFVKFRHYDMWRGYRKENIELLNGTQPFRARTRAIASQPDWDQEFIQLSFFDLPHTKRTTHVYRVIKLPPVTTHQKAQNYPCTLNVYSIKQYCYRCCQYTETLTYMLFDDDTGENVLYPWDTTRLNLLNRRIYNSCEVALRHKQYGWDYPIVILGDDRMLDVLLAEQFPNRVFIKQYKNNVYGVPEPICQHCNNHLYCFDLFYAANKRILNNKDMPVIATIDLQHR